MSVVEQLAKAADSGVDVVDYSEQLSRFLEPDCAAAIWHRQTPPSIQVWLDALAPELLPKGRVVLRPDAVAKTVDHLCDMSKLPNGPERDWFIADITSLAVRFSGLMSATFLRLRLDVVTTNACRKFHVDAIKGRLVCTFRGTGTQYGLSMKGDDPQRVFTVPTGAPILLRGSLWPEQPAKGLLHRSPPIQGTGETRLVLVLDPVSDPEGE
ncbi:MAG: DUF1826 domain-containing protein [Pelagimonas sp.]|uniref:DUF1826 domain-containing protein n=1 Tax=Pelagimonas sp. TaxID=2073170 RepID=UPI003D6A3113